MSRQIQHRRGDAAAHTNFIGAVGEITMDTTFVASICQFKLQIAQMGLFIGSGYSNFRKIFKTTFYLTFVCVGEPTFQWYGAAFNIYEPCLVQLLQNFSCPLVI